MIKKLEILCKKRLKFNSNISWSKSLKSFVKKSLKFNSNFFVQMVHFFPVKVKIFIGILRVFFLKWNFFTKFKGIFPAPQRKNSFIIRGKGGWRGGMRPIKARENKMGHLSCCLGLLPPSFIHISSGESRLFVRFRHLLPFDTVTLFAALPCGGRMCILTRIRKPNQSSSLSRRRRSLRHVFL